MRRKGDNLTKPHGLKAAGHTSARTLSSLLSQSSLQRRHHRYHHDTIIITFTTNTSSPYPYYDITIRSLEHKHRRFYHHTVIETLRFHDGNAATMQSKQNVQKKI